MNCTFDLTNKVTWQKGNKAQLKRSKNLIKCTQTHTFCEPNSDESFGFYCSMYVCALGFFDVCSSSSLSSCGSRINNFHGIRFLCTYYYNDIRSIYMATASLFQ